VGVTGTGVDDGVTEGGTGVSLGPALSGVALACGAIAYVAVSRALWKTWVASMTGAAGVPWRAQPARRNANKMRTGRVIFIIVYKGLPGIRSASIIPS
jgi:hypothetical protein